MLPMGLYFMAALVGSSIAANPNWIQPATGIDIYAETNGVHVSLIVPISIPGEDLSDLIRPEHLLNRNLYGTHAMVGWGHSGVYRNAPTWSGIRGKDIASAVFGSDDTTLHIYHLTSPQPAPYRKKIRVSPAQYHVIIQQIRAAFRLNAKGQSVTHPAYGPNNLFYESHGHYNAVHTCNNWTGTILKKAGVKVGVWTPLAGGVMWWF